MISMYWKELTRRFLLNRRGVHLYSGSPVYYPTVNQREDGSDLSRHHISVQRWKSSGDATLRTETETFAHSLVLSARSPVFDMFDSDFKELNGIVDIVDLEDDTYAEQHMHTSDIVDEITWESALKLFTAADKYQRP
ncbi:hypothetical protein NPIL_315991 [Nephila pilipes]|uniref:BTB domain-containing protein n=1 Tax=Nephila pilipes TaxID=299642 RepID=A0A8X6NF10_NEPPI|nr:hypothetical protein NPIL_315991 [Nephila pilipes]